MNKLYRKSEIWFAVSWIIAYVVGTSITDQVSRSIGMVKSVSLLFHLVLCAAALLWIRKNGLFQKYGLCKPDIAPSRFLYYIPLVVAASCNLWFGVTCKYSLAETVLYIGSMLCVGFLEELIFRGFLFQAMRKDGERSAIIVSSITFGIGHIVNLINGSGASVLSNLCQVCYAIAFGFLFVTIFYRGKTLLPCIATHSILNALGVFRDEVNVTEEAQIITSLILCVIAIGYVLILNKTLPKRDA